MIEQILIIESDKEFADKLVTALKKIGAYTAIIAADVMEASLLLTRQERDLAFIPVTAGDNIIKTLRSIQPTLRLALMTPSANTAVPDAFAGQVQAVLLKSHLDTDLPALLKEALSHPLIIEKNGASQSETEPYLETAVLLNALQKINLGKLIHTVIFAQKTDLLAHWGELNITQAATVALIVGDKWEATHGSTLVQFIHLAALPGNPLLYTRTVANKYLFTLVALPETPLRELRQQSDKLITTLTQLLLGNAPPEAEDENITSTVAAHRKSYAILWRPIRPIPKALHIPLRRAIERLAVTNACDLDYTNVNGNLVHLVVTCPSERDGGWAAYLFKNGSESIIQREYGVAATLWDTGHYSTESSHPLTEAELNIFLKQALSK